MTAKLQVALDFVDLHRALKVARESVAGGADWLEVGTPLIKSEGLNAVRRLREEFPQAYIVADMKTMDAGRAEMEMAAKAGASAAVVLGVACDSTIRECIEAGRNYGIEVGVDLIGVEDPVGRARQAEDWGAAHVGIHTAIDEQMRGADPFEKLKAIRRAVRIPISAAGGINSETVVDAVEAGADIVIVGGAITKASDAEKATAEIKRAIATRTKVKTDLFKRVGAEQVREALRKVSTANISDGNHRMPGLTGLLAITPDVKMVGTAMTVRTYPGDWAKSVEAIDRAQAGDVIVVDAGGLPPAIWGELATDSAVQRRLAGVVIYGAIRDTEEIRKRKFPAFARLITPQAGEPKGFGEIGVPITIGGITVSPGDWVVGDDDGVIVIPKREAVEIANRAMDWLEKENRIRQEIEDGKTTLGKVTDLLKWEKK